MKYVLIVLTLVLFIGLTQAQTREEQRFEVQKSDAEWKAELGEQEYKVLCGGATEAPFTGKYLYNKAKGTYTCGACNAPLFSSEAKFDSGSGWPSFYEQISKDAILEVPDYSLGMKRTEIVCAKCGGHLGHVFNDGPNPTGMRYCVNSVSLGFVGRDSIKTK